MVKISIHRGFTLIELMITVAIVGILAAIAYPSYQEHVLKSWRANAASCLLEMANRMERRYTGSSSYAAPTDDALTTSGCATEGDMPGRYGFAYNGTPNATTFQIDATPESDGPQVSDDCGTLTINQWGQKGAAGADPSTDEGKAKIAECWRR
ncbi:MULTISPECIES: type IV pilin protein [Thiorhodovibrio]|uniref:type IV pilin protein n=1 Tax=Thiorhodovibrio TaxID=61593 RepID=UPI001914CC10|nr:MULTISPECIES: type IV pilin protein [Thiorhodovibrio]MBK5969782.1 pilus assembly protein PilE [Thiorhodovibrio winogradskyi]WPL12174.1 Pilin [Thiorhodovibrio litoralis]